MAKRTPGMAGMMAHKHKMFKMCSIAFFLVGIIWSAQDLGFIATGITFWPGAFLVLGLIGLLGSSMK